MNIHITHVSVRFDFAFTYNIPQGCAYAHLRIPYLTEQALQVSWKSHHIRHCIFISWTWTTRPIILAGYVALPSPARPGLFLTQIFRSWSDNWLHLSTCQPGTVQYLSVFLRFSFPLVYTQHNFSCLWKISGIPVFTRQFQNKVES